jgi:hypothetical protein
MIRTKMKGIFELKTAADLFRKLESDYDALRGEPTHSYVAYDFFVTGWHLLEWLYPHDESRRNTLRDEHPILQVCEHLAVGAKHFGPTNRHLNSVKESGRSSHWPEGFFHEGYWPEGYWRDALTVELSGAAREVFGPQVDVLPLAEAVMTFWKRNADLKLA